MGFLSGVAGAIGGVASTILGNNSAKHEAEVNRDWQENMSNTSVQRRVEDLKAAGLNPLLAVSSASSGASTPTGAQAQLKHFNPADISALASARLVSAQAKAQEQENSMFDTKMEGLKLQNELMQRGVINSKVEEELDRAKTFGEIERALTEGYKRANINASTEKIRNEATLLGIDLYLLKNGPVDSPYLGANDKWFADNTKSPTGAIGFTSALIFNRIIRDFEAWKKRFVPRQINERRISR